jgi:hypothetical protein
MARTHGGPFARLREALVHAVYKNVIGCVASSVLWNEAELLRDPESVFALCRELSPTRANHPLRVQEAQIYRAFGRFRRAEAPLREISPPRHDAFEKDLQAWQGNLTVHTRFPTPLPEIAKRRDTKISVTAEFERIYGQYASENLSFAEIEKRETDGQCNLLCGDLTFYALATSRTYRGFSRSEAESDVRRFLHSEHVRLLPFVIINGRLHAALAMACRNANARRPKTGDANDIEHLRTYVPYVDVFITDGNMASIANQGNVRLAKEYGTVVRSLGESEADEFVTWLQQAEAASETAAISARVYKSIDEGGYLKEFAELASRYVARLKPQDERPA